MIILKCKILEKNFKLKHKKKKTEKSKLEKEIALIS